MKELLFICFGSACLTHFFDACFNEGMIFHSWYKLIERLPAWLFKPLGGCSYCFGAWIFLILYAVSIAEFSTLIVLGIGINHVFMRLIERI